MAEGGGLLNRYTLSRRIEGSNPSVSASSSREPLALTPFSPLTYQLPLRKFPESSGGTFMPLRKQNQTIPVINNMLPIPSTISQLLSIALI